MKKVYLSFLLAASTCSIHAQSLILHLDGTSPNPLADKTAINTVTTNGSPVDTGGIIQYPTGTDYLIIDTVKSFDINGEWELECKIKLADTTDEICLVDFRSTSSTGNMYFYYNRYGHGLHFSDRRVNGDGGYIVADQQLLPQNTWVTVKLQKQNGHMRIFRDGIQTADSTLLDTLSPVAKTTIGYSEDRRMAHSLYGMDDLKLWNLGLTSGIQNANKEIAFTVYPNPAGNNSYVRVATTETAIKSSLYNLYGELIRTSTSQDIFIGDLASGAYIIEVKTADGGKGIKKLVK